MYDERQLQLVFSCSVWGLLAPLSLQGGRESKEGKEHKCESIQGSYQETPATPLLKKPEVFLLRGCARHSRERDTRFTLPEYKTGTICL